MPDPTPAPDLTAARWHELKAALHSVNMADFEAMRGNLVDASMHLDDARRAIGGVALLLSDEPDARSMAHLLNHVLGGPTNGR